MRAKIVNEEFIQQMTSHWSSKIIEKNEIDYETIYEEKKD
jgi:hypothetical protein